MLEELLGSDTADKKKEKLSEEHGIIMNKDTERRLNTMCNLSEALIERTAKENLYNEYDIKLENARS